MNEFDFIEYLKKKISSSGRIPVGIGDDAAVLNVTPGKQLVVSTDAIVEGVDFKIKGVSHHFPKKVTDPFLSPERIGRKALAINLSDLAAMGAKPIGFVITVGKPKHIPASWLKRFYDGLLKLAKEYDVPCVGGDFSSAKELFANVTIFGECAPHHGVMRSGAMAGDWIAVTGALGGSLLKHHHDFMPRVMEGRFLSEKFTPTAMIDISDGLVQDIGHILKASRVGAVLEMDKIPVSKDAKKMARAVILRSAVTKNLKLGSFAFCETQDDEALRRALSDGEDFELLFTVPPWQKVMLEKNWKKRFPKVPLTWIGKIEGKTPKVRWTVKGKTIPAPKLPMKGYAHF